MRLASTCGWKALLAAFAVGAIAAPFAFAGSALAALPDGRGYELVSPANTEGQPVAEAQGSPLSSSDGNRVAFESANGFPVPGGTSQLNAYVATRGIHGWTTVGVSPPAPPGLFNAPVAVGWLGDLAAPVWDTIDALDPGDTNGNFDLYAVHGPGDYQWISQAASGFTDPGESPLTKLGFGTINPTFAGGSTDGSNALFEMNAPLASGVGELQSGAEELYDRVGGQTIPVGLNSDGSMTSTYGAVAGAGATADGTITHAISSDGSRIFFTSPDPASGHGVPQLYVRENPASAGATTIEVSASHGGADPTGSQPAIYQGASADGSKVFFTSKAELTSDANTGSGDAGDDLYEYDVSSGTLTDLSVDTSSADAATGADVQGVAQISDDGSHAYFVATGQLVPGEGTDGSPNLYVYSNGTVRFIATLAPGIFGDQPLDWGPPGGQAGPDVNHGARTTPDGRYLLFMTHAQLVPADVNKDVDIYLYDSQSAKLSCLSCVPNPPDEGTTNLDASFLTTTTSAPGTGYNVNSFPAPRNLTEDGSGHAIAYFETPKALVPRDSNGQEDVYEWEPVGSGSCTTATASSTAVYKPDTGGCVALISDGTSSYPSDFGDASPDASNVFFFTSDLLVQPGQDEGARAVYDARIGGGFPPPPPPRHCSGDSCQGPPSPLPPPPTAATITFSGPGNVIVKVLSKVVHTSTFFVRVRVPGRGRITITGAGIRTVSRSLAKAGTYRLQVTLTPGEKNALTRKHELRLKLRVRYAPAHGAPSTATVRLTVTLAVRHRRRAHTARATGRDRGGAR